VAFVVAVFLAATAGLASAGPFTAGNIVVYRVGDGAQALSNNGNPVFLDEYTPAGGLVQAVAIPASASGANHPLIAQGATSSGSAIEGLIARSTDGQYVVMTGYGTTVGGADVLSATACMGPGGVPRVVGRVKYDGSVDTSTALTDFACSSNPRAATSSDGTSIWVAGNGTGASFTTLGSATSTMLDATNTNVRQLQILSGQLYGAVNKSTVSTIGTGLPTTGGQTTTALSLPNVGGSPDGFFFATLPGGTVLYLADDTAGTIQKWSLVSGSWTDDGAIAYAGARSVFGLVSGASVTLYLRASGATIDTLTDASGFNGALTGTPSASITAPANETFKGIASAPVSAGGPLPTATATAPAATGTGPTATPTFTAPVATATPTLTATPPPRTPTPVDTAPLPQVDPKAVLGCERSLNQASTALVTADLAMLERCSQASFLCIQSAAPGALRDACFAKARAACAKAHDAMGTARGAFEAGLAASCGGSPARVPLSLLRAASVLGFETLESACQQHAGLTLNSLGAISQCIQTAATCRAERAFAIAVPRIADLLAPVLDSAAGLCLPAPSGNQDGLADPTDATRAVHCQTAVTKGARSFVRRRLALTQKCVDTVLSCRLTGQPTSQCARMAATCDKKLGLLSTGSRGATAKMALGIARACGPLDPASLLDANGPGFGGATARCNAFGGGPFAAMAVPRACVATTKRSCLADAIGRCVANAFDCASTAIVSDALPLAADELGRFDVQLSENPYCAAASDPDWTRDATEPANLLDVTLRDLHPTQAVLGFDEIYYKLGRYRGTKDEAGGGHNKRFDDWCETNGQVEAVSVQAGARLNDPSTFTCSLPMGSETPDSLNLMKTVVIGPGGQLYLEDGHHTMTEFWEQPDGGPDLHIRLRVVGNLSHLDPTAFWREMQVENRVLLVDADNLPITVDDLPQTVGLAGFQDDKYRGLIYFTRDIGYAVPTTEPEYLEFQWGAWLRQRLDISTFNLTDLESYLALVKMVSMEMTSLRDTTFVRSHLTAGQLGKLSAWNAGLPETAGEFAKLSKPITASKPGKVAYAIDYKASLAP
jgi:hypothetical protein